MPDPAQNPLLLAALGYARRGWPVFPCNPENKQPLLAADRDPVTQKKIKGSGGVSKATTDEEQIRAWWKRWPKAMIGVAMGRNQCFALDFDPRSDEGTGEVFTLERLKAETEAMIGCALPETLAAVTPSDGVHVYYRQPAGEPIRNRGNLPEHVDVRGAGGYVIAPPSVMADGRRYRWLRGNWNSEIAEAPEALVALLRDKGKKGSMGNPMDPGRSAERRRSRAPAADDQVDEAVRKYALAALDAECQELRRTPEGGGPNKGRNGQLNVCALKIASLVAAGALDEAIARPSIEAAARAVGLEEREIQATLDSGWSAGMNNPRDLSEVAAAARERAARPPGRRSQASSSSPRTPQSTDNGKPSSRGGGSGATGPPNGSGAAERGDLTRRCAFYAHTDLGNLERFLARYGQDFLYVEQWGWLAWTGKRWSRELAEPLLGYAVQQTLRAIQEEAELIRESGVPEPPMEMWDASQKAAHAEQQKRKLDRIVKRTRGEITLLSETIAKWGRTSESAGHIGCIPKLAESRLSARTEDFDADPLQLNVDNGTLVFLRPAEGFPASVAIREHRREDRNTKIAAVHYDPAARSPLYDRFLEEVQPKPDMREFLDTWAGYSALGLAEAQKMVLFYGEGSNGKGVWVTTHAYILGDYAWAAAIETFIDQGKYRKGSDASPDLAALAGRRMVYANEPEEGSKFSDGLIKALTSDDPIGGVRELMRPPFTLTPTFSNTVMANNKPKIGTDHGIQRRLQLVPWDVIIPDERTDVMLKVKLRDEASGILNRIVRGALTYLTQGLSIPETVKEATKEYHQENDLLGQFLDLVIARVPGSTIGASPLQKLFAAWQTWSGNLPQTGKAWSAKHLRSQMEKKKFRISKSSTMQWQDIAARFEVHHFIDADGSPATAELPPPKTFDVESGRAPPAPTSPRAPPDDDDFVPGFD
jgi:putative DNA primase/helicase